MVIFISSKILVFVWELCGYILDLLNCKGQVFRRKVKTWKYCKASSLFNDILVTKWRCTYQKKKKKKELYNRIFVHGLLHSEPSNN
jgi:hypothetical protein